MPAYQEIQASTSPLAQAAGNFGRGFSSRLLQDLQADRAFEQQQNESDVMNRILSGIGQETSGEDAIQQIFGARGLGFDKKEKLANAVTKVREKASKTYEKKQQVEHGLDLVARQRKLLETGHLGEFFTGPGKTSRKGLIPTKEATKVRAEYQRLGKALISMSSNIPIRNRQEFEVLAADLYDPDKSKEEAAGILDAMELILRGSLESEEGARSIQQPSQIYQQNRPPLTAFGR